MGEGYDSFNDQDGELEAEKLDREMSRPRKIHPKVKQAIEEIDAAVFSGDTFINGENIQKLQAKLDRWNRGLKEHRATLKELLKADEDFR